MVKLLTRTYLLAVSLIIAHVLLPAYVEAGLMKKMGGMGGGGMGGGVMELLVAGIVAKLLGDMKMNKGGQMNKGGSSGQGMTKYVPVPLFVASGGSMMDSGWKGGMMMNSGWPGGMMMNSGWPGGMMNNGWKGGMMNNGWKGGMMMGGD